MKVANVVPSAITHYLLVTISNNFNMYFCSFLPKVILGLKRLLLHLLQRIFPSANVDNTVKKEFQIHILFQQVVNDHSEGK